MKTKTLKVKHFFDELYQPIAINGVSGSGVPSGDIIMNMYYERPAIPKSTEIEIDENGVKISEKEVEKGADYIRVFQTGVIMNFGTAVAVRDWLNSMITQIESLNSKEV